jgi:hypothetical protein
MAVRDRAHHGSRGRHDPDDPPRIPEKFLARLVSEGRTIRHFEHALPSLDEIFLKVTGATL